MDFIQRLDEVAQGVISVEKQEQHLIPLALELLLKSVKSDLRPEYRRRIEIILRADMGQSQAEICAALECSPETARYWIAMTKVGQAHNWIEHPLGRPKTVNDQYVARLKELVSHSPKEYGYSFRRWTAQWLRKHLAKELGIEVSARHINRLLQQMGLSTRQKSKRVEKATELLSTSGFGITIGDLQPPSSPEFFQQFNLDQLSN